MRFSAGGQLLAMMLAVCPLAACQVAGAQGPVVDVELFEANKTTRAVIACRGPAAHLEVDAALPMFGVRTADRRTVVSVNRKEGVATCVAGTPPSVSKAAARMRPLSIRAVTPSVVRERGEARLVLSIDGQALGPRVAADDGVYLVSRGTILPVADKCPEARHTDDRVVACIAAASVAGRGPARVRVQSAGRLEEAAGAPIDLSVLVAPKTTAP